jgi:hypothetical protein
MHVVVCADRPSDLEAAVHDVVETLGRLNLELNGPVPRVQGPSRGRHASDSSLHRDQDALIQLATSAKRAGGLSENDAATLQEWADEYVYRLADQRPILGEVSGRNHTSTSGRSTAFQSDEIRTRSR